MELHPGDTQLFIDKLEQGDFSDPAEGGAWGDYTPDFESEYN